MKTITATANTTLTLLALLLAFAQTITPAWSQPELPNFTQVISIGDSLSDTGNTNDASFGVEPSGNYFMGRFSNGQLWNELLALELGLSPPIPSRDGGDNWAYGGALTSEDVVYGPYLLFIYITLPAATQQIFDYVNSVSLPDKDALYTLSIGGNDVLGAGDALPANPTTAQLDAAKLEMFNVAGSIEVALQHLLDQMPNDGIARVAVLNLPNVGITPRATAESKQFVYEQLTIAYNDGLAAALSSINDERLLPIDFFKISNQAAANPASFGLTNASDRCWQESDGSVCTSPDDYLFWDDIHPTTMGHTLIMLEVLQQLAPELEPVNVPVAPAYAWLLLLLLAGVTYRINKVKHNEKHKRAIC